MKATTGKTARRAFPIATKHVCGSPKCKHAVCVCMACLRRGCRHRHRDGGYVNVVTGTDERLAKAPTDHGSPLLNVGHCGCAPITRAAGVARVLAHIEAY